MKRHNITAPNSVKIGNTDERRQDE
jgi:hypothetical protein